MFGFVRGLAFGLVLIGFGWLGGSLYPAPDQIVGPLAARIPNVVARFGLDDLSLDRLRTALSADDFGTLRREATDLAARAGEAIVVERDAEALAEQIATLPNATPQAPQGPQRSMAFEAALLLCPGMTVSNAPQADANRQVRNYARLINVEGVTLATNPTLGACLSSAFGPRGRGQHKGVDYYARDGGPILAAADGTVIEAKYRDDYGNMLLIDHGGGVYTRYAHLSSFADGVVVGARVTAGQQIGLMGNTASYAIPVHLHYEILTGNYDNPRASFGLDAHSPFSFAAAN